MRNGAAAWCLTFDVDWAPRVVLQDTLDLLAEFGVQATFFATHAADVDFGPHEVGIHADFTPRSDWAAAVRELKQSYPDAVGARGHSLTFGFRIFELYRQAGIRYLSDYLCYGVPHLQVFELYQGICEFPIWFMDNAYVAHFGDGTFSWDSFDLQQPQLRVFAFHPIHVFLNTEHMDRWEAAKQHLHRPDKLAQLVHPGRGIRTMLRQLLQIGTRRQTGFQRLCDILIS